MKLLSMNLETMRRVSQLMRKCPSCNGSGKLLQRTPGVTYTVECVMCNGKGSIVDTSFDGRQPNFETGKGMVIS